MKANLLPVLKMAAIVAALTFLGFAIIAGTEWYRYRQSDEYRALQELKKLEEQYRNDPYGGSTPEETLSLFTKAIENEDVELAAKYFTYDVREKWDKNLKSMKENNTLKFFLRDLKSAHATTDRETGQSNFSYSITNIKNETVGMISLVLMSGKWKITNI